MLTAMNEKHKVLTYFSLAVMKQSLSKPECFSTCMRASLEEFL